MARIVEFAYRKGGGGPAVAELPYTTGQTFKRGAIVKLSSGSCIIATATETAAVIAGVALQAAGSNPGYDAANSPTVITGQSQTVAVALADRLNVFKAFFVNGSDTPINAANSDRGVSYGVRILADGSFAVNKGVTSTNDIVTVVDFDANNPTVVYFTFNAADSAEV